MCWPSRSTRVPRSWRPSCVGWGSPSAGTGGCCWSRWSPKRPTTSSSAPSPRWTCRCTGWTSAGTGSPSCSPTRRCSMSPVEPAPASVIHDLGYQRYTGPRLGRRYAALSLYTHSLRTAFGLGRSAKAKVFPWIVVGFTFVVAVVAVVVRSQTNVVFINYLQYPDNVSVPLLLFLAVVTPELVSRDLQTHVLPLYFSRPLGRNDYALAKLAAVVSAAWLILAGPELLMLLGGIFSQQGGWSGTWNEFTDFLGGITYAAIMALVFGSLAL